MSDIPKPKISDKFTIEDIHKIREWNYERRKNMSKKEIIADIEKGAEAFKILVEAKKQQMHRESFDYTEWQHDLFKDVSLDRLLHDADEYSKKLTDGNYTEERESLLEGITMDEVIKGTREIGKHRKELATEVNND